MVNIYIVLTTVLYVLFRLAELLSIMAEVPLDAHGIPVCLPQFDPNPDIRAEGLGLAANEYVLFQNAFGLSPNQQNLVNIVNIPPMVSILSTVLIFMLHNLR